MESIYEFDPERFYLGKLCVHGHSWPGTEQSLRRLAFNKLGQLNGNNCIGCTGRKGSSWLLSFIDYQAMGWPTNQTLGKLCKKDHKWEGQNASLRRWGKCVECERLRKVEQSQRTTRKTARRWIPELRGLSPTERRKLYKRKLVQELRSQGLTVRGTVPTRADAGVARGERNESIALERTFERALRITSHAPNVARLVMDEQLRHWRENPEEKRRHDKEWDQASWWLKYQINPELRLYHREKSKRRKAQDRGQTPVQIPVAALRQRFNEFGNCCAYCGDGGDMQIEHIEPISKGGAHDIGNIVPACSRCNTSKRTNIMEEWYQSQPFFSELRLHRIRRVMRQPEAYQLAIL